MRNQPRVFVRPEVFEAAATLRRPRRVTLPVHEPVMCGCAIAFEAQRGLGVHTAGQNRTDPRPPAIAERR
jgi:hypothetical protein